jgi:hypothetical protein
MTIPFGIDNQQHKMANVLNDLLAHHKGLSLDITTSYFNVSGWQLLRELLDWLVTALTILLSKEGRKGIDVLTGKAQLADYLGDYQKDEQPLAIEELLDILRKNKNRLGVSLSDASLIDHIKKTYQESLQRVLPLKERLAQTDRLIDQVVYRLYGLTEEEIRVVEGRG